MISRGTMLVEYSWLHFNMDHPGTTNAASTQEMNHEPTTTTTTDQGHLTHVVTRWISFWQTLPYHGPPPPPPSKLVYWTRFCYQRLRPSRKRTGSCVTEK
ncbi:hypothetical protein Pcinc_030615 [Petrolisthes cinctipes]|uniref:Uncharacterized protein n=1 Tax=Petrolisthes cinctipes TaxID=88211 RepID=A0AAE1K5T0_PETCI|nr:hypothetical protein Pcinc_030615 [Petrolisthes cinctipes]